MCMWYKMGIFRKKKKEKVKKPWTRARVVKIAMPLILIAIIIFSGYQTFTGCAEVYGTYKGILRELNKNFDVEDILDGEIITSSDFETLKEKLGEEGADMPIFAHGEIDMTLYAELNVIDVRRSFNLTDCELGVLTTYYVQDTYTNYFIDIMKLYLTKNPDETYSCEMVYELDLSNLTKDLGDGLSDINKVYVKSNSVLDIVGNNLAIVSSSSKINDLSEENNKTLVTLINTLTGNVHDVGMKIACDLVNDISSKTETNLSIDGYILNFELG